VLLHPFGADQRARLDPRAQIRDGPERALQGFRPLVAPAFGLLDELLGFPAAPRQVLRGPAAVADEIEGPALHRVDLADHGLAGQRVELELGQTAERLDALGAQPRRPLGRLLERSLEPVLVRPRAMDRLLEPQ
jgi:hypothetical protein